MNPNSKFLRLKAKIISAFSLYTSAFSQRRGLVFILALAMTTAGMFLTDAQIANSISANKPLMIGTTNEQPINANFWKSNATAISAAIGGGGGGGGGSDIYTTNFTTNGTGQIDLAGTPKQLTTNNAAGLTNLQAPQLTGTLPLATLPAAVITNNFAGIITFISSLAVDGAINCLATVNGAAAAITAGISGGSLNIATNATIGGTLTVNGANMSLVNPGGNTVVLSLMGQAAGGGSNSISTSPAGLFLNSPGYLIVTAPSGETVSGPLTVQNNATVNTNLSVGGALSVTGASTLGGNVGIGGTETVSGASSANSYTATAGVFSGSGAGLTGIPGSAITGPITVLNTNGLFAGATTYTNAPNANGVQMHIGVNSGALAIRGSSANTNSLSVESGLGAQFIQDWSIITASASNVVANMDTNGNLTLKNGGKLFGSVPSTNLDTSLGFWVLTNCYHDCQYATNGAVTNSTTFWGGPFTPADVGKEIDIGSGSGQQGFTISAYVAANQVTLSGAYSGSIGNTFYAWMHDDSATINSQITNALSNGCHTIIAPPGLYGLNSWTTLPYSAGYAAITVPFTNCDLVTNGEQSLKIMGLNTPQALAALNATFTEPLATNGVIFCCPTNPPSATAACVIGVPNTPSIMSGGFDGVKLILQDLTVRMAPNPGCTAIDGRYLAGLELHGTVVVDCGASKPFSTAPSISTSYGVYFPTINNYGKNIADFVYVEGYYTGFFINEHLAATYLFAECDHTGAQFGTSYHANYIGRMLVQGCGYSLYNNGALNETYIGELDVEEDETLVTGLNFVTLLTDTTSSQRGGVGMLNANVSAGVWGPATNSAGCANFNLPNVIPNLTQINVGQYSSLTASNVFSQMSAPTWDNTLTNMAADAGKAYAQFVTTNNVYFSSYSNGVAGNTSLFTIDLFGGTTNRTIVFPNTWLPFNCTYTNTLLSNEWTSVHFRILGATNIMVKMEAQ